jgi:serine/threonine-protein kinase
MSGIRESTETGAGEDPLGLVGETVDKYVIVRPLGRGGMGCVYEALNTVIQKRVALKCIDPALAKSAEAVARFHREALAAGAVDSPHIVQIFDAGVTGGGAPYLVMELLRGRDLGRLLVEAGRLEAPAAARLTAQILRGLAHAHGAGIVHRDLKPDNVFLVEREDEAPTVKLLDFGVSKIARGQGTPRVHTITRAGVVVGTPYYMAPEQAQAFVDVDGRADLYSAGAILYECLAGRPPHVGQSYEQVIVNICVKDAEDVRAFNPAVPEVIALFLGRALARERDERFASAREMLEALELAAPDAVGRSFSGRPSESVSGTRSPAVAARTPGSDQSTPVRVVPSPASPEAPNGLADTLEVATPVGRAGRSAEAPAATTARTGVGFSSTDAGAAAVPSRSLEGGRRGRTLALALGAATAGGVVVAVVLSLRSSPPPPSAEPTTAAPAAAASIAAERPEPAPASSAPPSASAPEPSASARSKAPPPRAPLPPATSAPPSPSKRPKLELVKEY